MAQTTDRDPGPKHEDRSRAITDHAFNLGAHTRGERTLSNERLWGELRTPQNPTDGINNQSAAESRDSPMVVSQQPAPWTSGVSNLINTRRNLLKETGDDASLKEFAFARVASAVGRGNTRNIMVPQSSRDMTRKELKAEEKELKEREEGITGVRIR